MEYFTDEAKLNYVMDIVIYNCADNKIAFNVN